MCEWRTTARSPSRSGTADREEVERPIEVGFAQREVGRRDRRHETAIERIGEAQGSMDAVPAETERELVRAQLAGVEQTEDRDVGEGALEQSPVLVQRVLADVPRVVGALGSRLREGEPVRSRDVGQ